MQALLALAIGRGLVDGVGAAILHSVWQVTLVAGATGLTLAMLKRSSAAARYVVACAGLVSSLALPIATVLAGDPTSIAAASLGASQTIAPGSLPAAGGQAAFVAAYPTVARSTLDSAFPWLVAAWAAGVMLLSLRLVGGWLAAARLTRQAVQRPRGEWRESFDRIRTRLRMARSVRLLESAAVSVPTVIGWMRPVVLLPVAALSGLTPRQVDAIIAHELAHVRRYDYLVNLFQVGIETVLFYHPAVWWLSRRIRAEREHCCDDVAVRLVGDALGYARALTQLEERRERATALALAATGGTLMNRIRHLRLGTRDRAPWPTAVGIFLALVAIGVTGAVVATAAHAPTRSAATMAQAATAATMANGQDITPPATDATAPQGAPPKTVPGPDATQTPQASTPTAGDRDRYSGQVDFARIDAEIQRALRDAERQYAMADRELRRALSPTIQAQVQRALRDAERLVQRESSSAMSAERKAEVERALRDAFDVAQREQRHALTPEREAEIRRSIEDAKRHLAGVAREMARHQSDYARLMQDYRQQIKEYTHGQWQGQLEAHREEMDKALRDYREKMRDYGRQLRDFERRAGSDQSTPPVPPAPPSIPVPQIVAPVPPAPPAIPTPHIVAPAPPVPPAPPRSRRGQATAPPAPPSASALPAPPAPPAPPALPAPSSLFSHASDETETHISRSNDGHTLDVRAKGKVEFSDDGSDIQGLSPGGYIIISGRDGGKNVTFEARSVNGSIERKWTGLSGDAERQRWLASHLADLRRP